MMNLALIPARGGSKRIPQKNIMQFMGKPMIAYAIELAKQSHHFDTVMVSTDDQDIANVAVSYGAEVPFLRTSAADDNATLLDVIANVVEEYQSRGKSYDAVCCILPTAVLARVSDLNRCYSIFESGIYDSVFPVSKFPYPIQRALVRDENGLVKMERPEFGQSRSQDLEPTFHDAGQFYWLRPKGCLSKKSIITDSSRCIILPECLVQDIDEEDDLIMAEAKFHIMAKRRDE